MSRVPIEDLYRTYVRWYGMSCPSGTALPRARWLAMMAQQPGVRVSGDMISGPFDARDAEPAWHGHTIGNEHRG